MKKRKKHKGKTGTFSYHVPRTINIPIRINLDCLDEVGIDVCADVIKQEAIDFLRRYWGKQNNG